MEGEEEMEADLRDEEEQQNSPDDSQVSSQWNQPGITINKMTSLNLSYSLF